MFKIGVHDCSDGIAGPPLGTWGSFGANPGINDADFWLGGTFIDEIKLQQTDIRILFIYLYVHTLYSDVFLSVEIISKPCQTVQTETHPLIREIFFGNQIRMLWIQPFFLVDVRS